MLKFDCHYSFLAWIEDFKYDVTRLYCQKPFKNKRQGSQIAFAMRIKRIAKRAILVFEKLRRYIRDRRGLSVLYPLSGLRSQLHNSEDAFTSADMFASWVRVRSKRNGPLSWMRVPRVGGGKGIEKVGSRRSLRGTPSCQLITNSGHHHTINQLTPKSFTINDIS